jgi:hypothetical protein
MKKIILLIAIFQICQSVAFSQGCPPAPQGVAFYSQSSINDFQTNYPGCTQIEGAVVISGPDITNLNGLSMVTSVAGQLQIAANTNLTDLSGLEKLTFIGNYLEIYSNNSLTSIQALNQLTYVGGPLYINFNNSLTSLAGLEKLTQVNGNLGIAYNPALKSLSGLQNIRSIGGYLSIGGNNALTNITDLKNVFSISGDLAVYYNPALASLHGLDSIKAGSINSLMITHNTKLSICEVRSICSYLASPNGSVDIQFNASGCNSTEEVLANCATVSVGNQILSEGFSLYPNPFTRQFTFKFYLHETSTVNLIVYNNLGQVKANLSDVILSPGIHLKSWNTENFPPGIYTCRLQTGKQVKSVKIIKMEY